VVKRGVEINDGASKRRLTALNDRPVHRKTEERSQDDYQYGLRPLLKRRRVHVDGLSRERRKPANLRRYLAVTTVNGVNQPFRAQIERRSTDGAQAASTPRAQQRSRCRLDHQTTLFDDA
jgi:hypothetical protein